MSELRNLVSLGLKFTEPDRAALSGAGFSVAEYLRPEDLEAGIKAAAAAGCVCISGPWMRHIGKDFASKLERCRLIVTSGPVDLLDMDEASFRGISVAVCSQFSAPAVAEHAFTILLALARRLPHRGERAAVPDLAGHEEMAALHRGMELRTKTLGLIGYGAVGQAIVPIARGFGMKVLVARPNLPPFFSRLAWDRRVTFTRFSEILPLCDVVIASLPGGIRTRRFFGENTFRSMRDNAIFVNVGRPSTVDEAELKAALERGDLAGAALDLVTPEGGAALRGLRNVFITPGLGWNTAEALERLSFECSRHVTDFFAGSPGKLVMDSRNLASRS